MEGDCIHIAIIGGGASGTLTAIQLLQKLNVKAKIFLIEKKGEAIYRGAAYSSQLAYEPLNVIAERMSIFNNLPDDFYTWLTENKQGQCEQRLTPTSFVSRRWFGEYMMERIKQAAVKSEFAELEVVKAGVTDINYNSPTDCYQLSLSTNSSINADYLVFATGNEPPADVLNAESIAHLGASYISNPWSCNALQQVKANDDILILGTGLTMVDHVVSLHKQKHKGKIYCLSRNGYLPLEHSEVQAASFDIDEEPTDIPELFRLIKARIDEAARKGVFWQNMLDALRPHTSRLWKNMDVESKKYFLARFKIFWEIHRHRMPIASAEIVNRMIANAQLTLNAGNAIGAKLNGGKIEFSYSPKGKAGNDSMLVDFVINCTGPSGDYYKCKNELIKNLLKKGWMQQDDLQLGIKTGARGEVIKSNGVILNNAFAIGPLRKAMEWESTAIREIRTQAENTALMIAVPAEKLYEIAVETGL